jgi:uncharacterized membrane protein
MSRRRGGHPVVTGVLVLFGIGLVIRVLAYLIAALLIAVLIWFLVLLYRAASKTRAARKHRAAAVLQAQQQVQLHEQQRLEAFLLPEDHAWMRQWT